MLTTEKLSELKSLAEDNVRRTNENIGRAMYALHDYDHESILSMLSMIEAQGEMLKIAEESLMLITDLGYSNRPERLRDAAFQCLQSIRKMREKT